MLSLKFSSFCSLFRLDCLLITFLETAPKGKEDDDESQKDKRRANEVDNFLRTKRKPNLSVGRLVTKRECVERTRRLAYSASWMPRFSSLISGARKYFVEKPKSRL